MFLSHLKPFKQVLIPLLLISAAGWTKEKAKIEVRVEEEKEARLDTTSHAQVIIPRRWRGQVHSVPKLLERAAGITLKQYGGLDDFAAVSIRGSTTEQVLVYLDGVLLNTAHGGVIDFSFLPLDQIERIEVYKGGAPGLSSDSAPGGVILIETKKRPARTQNIVRAHAGSFRTFRGHGERSQTVGPIYYHAAFDHFRSQGDFHFLDNRGTRANVNDDRIIRRTNNDFGAYDVSAAVGGAKPEALDWKLYENFFFKRQGIPGFGARTSSEARLQTLRNLFHATLGVPKQTDSAWRWQTDLFFDLNNSQFEDRAGEIGLGLQDNDDLTMRLGPKGEISFLGWKHHLWKGFLANRAEFFWPKNKTASPPEGPLSRRVTLGFGLEDEMNFFDDKLIVDPSGRVQILWNDLRGDDPSLATTAADNQVIARQLSGKLGVKFSPWRFLSFKTNLYRGFRQPTFTELFGDRGTIVGNPALQPETSLNFDFGAGLQLVEWGGLDSLRLGAAFFRNSISDLIQFLQTSQFTVRADNLNKALIWGGEFSASLRAWRNWRWSGSYVYQVAKDDEFDSPTYTNFLPGRPKHQAFLESDYQFPWWQIRPFVEAQIMGDNFLDSQNLLRVTRRTILGAGFHLVPWKRFQLTFTTKNLLNDRIEDVVGYPLPGRSYWGELELAL